MVPGAGVVAAPSGRVALAAGVTGARHYEGPGVRIDLQKAFKGAAAVLHAEDVVNLQMAGGAGDETWLLNAVLGVIRHGFGGNFEDGWLVHVVPEAGYAL
jgi:hypothetical protein